MQDLKKLTEEFMKQITVSEDGKRMTVANWKADLGQGNELLTLKDPGATEEFWIITPMTESNALSIFMTLSTPETVMQDLAGCAAREKLLLAPN